MDPLAELVGGSPAIEAVRDQIRRLVLCCETGRRLPSVLRIRALRLRARRLHGCLPLKPGLFLAAHRGVILLDLYHRLAVLTLRRPHRAGVDGTSFFSPRAFWIRRALNTHCLRSG